jgi:integrase
MATPKLISSFFQHLHATYSPGSIRTVASHIRSFLKSVEGGERFLCTVPSHCVRNKPIIQILSNLEHNALKKALQFSKISLRDKSIVLLALRTGLRAVDIVGLKLKDIDWIQETISVTQSKTGNSYKIPLPTDVGNLLSSYILDERPKTGSPYLFLRSLSPFRHLCGHSACYAVVRKLFRQAGIRLATERKGIHVIRHSVASQMLSKGVPVTTISSLLGHVDKRSTDVYLSTDEDRMRECCLDLTMISMNCERLK